jgi:hypothetical protein
VARIPIIKKPTIFDKINIKRKMLYEENDISPGDSNGPNIL